MAKLKGLMIKKILLYLSFFLLSLISTRSLFHQGLPVSHDANNHVVRFANYYLAIKEFQFPPRLGPNLLNHYGYPVFNYNYPLANIISLPFSILNFNYQTTFKIINFAFVFLGITGAYYFSRSKKFSKKASFFSAAIFAVTPYLLTSIIFRGNIGELMALGIFPWIFYFLERIKSEKDKLINSNFFFLFIFLNLLFLAHNIAAFFGSALIIFYLFFFFAKDWQKWKKFILVFLLAFAASLWFWLPALLEKNLTIMDSVDLTVNYYRHFPNLHQLLSLPISFGYSYWGNVDSMSLGIGALSILTLFLSLVLLLRKRADNKVFYFLSFLLFLFQLPFTKFIYDLIPFADYIQFPWRLSLLLAITLIPVSAEIFKFTNKSGKRLLILILFFQIIQVFSIKAVDYEFFNNVDTNFSVISTSTNKENIPKAFTYEYFNESNPSLEIINGEGTSVINKWRGSLRSYELHLVSDAIIVEPTAYFAGWQTKVKNLNEDNSWKKVEYIDNQVIKGRLAYQLKSGDYLVKSRFTQQTWPRLLGNTLSALTLFFVFMFLIKWKKEVKKSKKSKNR